MVCDQFNPYNTEGEYIRGEDDAVFRHGHGVFTEYLKEKVPELEDQLRTEVEQQAAPRTDEEQEDVPEEEAEHVRAPSPTPIASGVSYEGHWVKDELEGECTISFASGACYKGEIANSLYEGHGTYTWPNGSFYDGQWRSGQMHGAGQFTDKDGVLWEGTFLNNSGPGLLNPIECE